MNTNQQNLIAQEMKLSSFSWDDVKESEFYVFDRNFGYWTNTGFSFDKNLAKKLTKKTISIDEVKSVNADNCSIVLI